MVLDEIGDLSPAFQVRLLRVLQNKTYRPLGATGTVQANVRMLATTNKNLAELVERDFFRRDLFYRVNVVRLDLPPLRMRKEDIPLLVKCILGRLNCLRGKAVSGVSQKALSLLMFHDYPGDIRELGKILEHAFVLCPERGIELHGLPEYLRTSIRPHLFQRSMEAA